MIALPTLRYKILRSFSFLVALYAVLGVSLVITLTIASGTTPTLLHRNYDSIAASLKMNEAWTALQFPKYSDHDSGYWVKQFEEALRFEGGNITEPGEREIDQQLETNWREAKPNLGKLSTDAFRKMEASLKQLIQVNERGMFSLAQTNESLSHRVLIGTLIYFVISLIVAIIFGDNLAERISKPLKSIAEALHSRPTFGRRLKLPEPTHLEMLILTAELNRLWERLSQSEKVNVAELLTEKTKLEALLESVEDALLVLDPDGRVGHCNECMAELVGLPRNEIQGQLWLDLSSASGNYLKMRELLHNDLSDGQEIDLEWRQKPAFFSARSRRIESAQTVRAGVLFLLHDITDKKQKEKFRSEFVDLLSHELKTPLQSLGTASELLSRERLLFTVDQRLLIDTVAEDVNRIRAVAQEFVQITQSHAKILKLRLEAIDLNQVIPEWIKPFVLVAKDRKVRVEFSPLPTGQAMAHIDGVKFPWVISNLLSNAVRFSPNGGLILIEVSSDNFGLTVSITDEGPGIAEAERERVFEPFYQSTMSTSSGARGLFGIGLTIAKEVVEAHDGNIQYFAVEPHGSRFEIHLPVSQGVVT